MSGSIYLTTTNPEVLLNKPGKAGNDKIRIRTIWDATPEGWDLDGGVMWRSFNGKAGAIQALGLRRTSHRGSHYRLPYLKLNGDDRQGNRGGEIIDGNYSKVANSISWLGVYLYLYHDGNPQHLSKIKGARTIVEVPGLQPVEVVHTGVHGPACAILQIFNNPTGFKIKRDMRVIHHRGYVTEQEQIDRFWKVGLTWVPMTK